jgi:hypothetical protein
MIKLGMKVAREKKNNYLRKKHKIAKTGEKLAISSFEVFLVMK